MGKIMNKKERRLWKEIDNNKRKEKKKIVVILLRILIGNIFACPCSIFIILF